MLYATAKLWYSKLKSPQPHGFFFSKSFRGWFPCLSFTTLWLLHVRLKLFQLLNMIMITQWDFLVKFILQVFKWYMFPGTQPHPTPSIQFFSNIPESKWKDIFYLLTHTNCTICEYTLEHKGYKCSTKTSSIPQSLFDFIFSFYQTWFMFKITVRDLQCFTVIFFKNSCLCASFL